MTTKNTAGYLTVQVKLFDTWMPIATAQGIDHARKLQAIYETPTVPTRVTTFQTDEPVDELGNAADSSELARLVRLHK